MRVPLPGVDRIFALAAQRAGAGFDVMQAKAGFRIGVRANPTPSSLISRQSEPSIAMASAPQRLRFCVPCGVADRFARDLQQLMRLVRAEGARHI